MWILLAQAKSAKRLALNSRRCLLIRRMIHDAALRIANPQSGDAGRAHRGQLRGRVLAARSRPVTRLSGGNGRQNARTVWLASTAKFLALITVRCLPGTQQRRFSQQTLGLCEREASRSHIWPHGACSERLTPDAPIPSSECCRRLARGSSFPAGSSALAPQN